jgi:tRNA pseudouridine38-40 synthase
MPRYFIELMYEGNRYHGWQIQKNALGVQQVLNEALSVVFRTPMETLGCGRTDTGVHARQFFAHFDAPAPVENCENLVHRLNGLLPYDIAVKNVFQVRDSLNARFDAVKRTYQYFLYFNKNPFLKNRACWIHFMPDTIKMQEAASLLLKYDDFGCFSKNRTQVKTNICHLSEALFFEEKDMLVFRISADRFLRGMVRAIVGTLLKVGENIISLDEFKTIIEKKDRKEAGASVPPWGLYLEEVKYESFQ